MKLFPKVRAKSEWRDGLVYVTTFVDGEPFRRYVYTEEDILETASASEVLDLFPRMLQASNLIGFLHLIWLKIRTSVTEVEYEGEEGWD